MTLCMHVHMHVSGQPVAADHYTEFSNACIHELKFQKCPCMNQNSFNNYSNCKHSKSMVYINNMEKLQVQLLQATTDDDMLTKRAKQSLRVQNKGKI